MAHWILKTEPSDYSFADLRRDQPHPLERGEQARALSTCRPMAQGDEV